jgi:protein-disulfide isomerase
MKFAAIALAGALLCAAAGAPEADKGKILGNQLAPVKIEVFSDFMCAGCRQFHEQTLPLLMRDFVTTGKVYIISREYPLARADHKYSRDAANYATAAAKVGRYDQVATVLFHTQEQWGVSGKVWDTVASALTPDQQKKVQALAKEPAIIAQVQADVMYGNSSGINQTPTLFISRGPKPYTVSGTMSYTLLKSLLNDLLK